MVPYAPSYALEILSQSLEEKPLFLQRKSNFGLTLLDADNVSDSQSEENFHDAFYDTKETLALFCYLIDFLHLVQENTPILTTGFCSS